MNSLSVEAFPIADPPSRTPTCVFAGIRVPLTAFVVRSLDIARAHLEPRLFNHAIRSWLIATTLAEQEELAHDAEVLAVAVLLHDIGVADGFTGPLRFELEGANFAQELASGFAVEEGRARLIWGAIALSTTASVHYHRSPEVSLCARAVALDRFGDGSQAIAPQRMTRILEAFPRLGMERRFATAMREL